MTSVQLTVNGAAVELFVEPRTLLVDVLRDHLGLTGTHVGCAYGVCGACTVVVDGLPVRSCLMLAAQADGAQVKTVEGLADAGDMSALQEAFHNEHGLQCGFCTPGLLCSLTALQEGDDDVSETHLDDVIAGHLCRCTGYAGIRRASRVAFGFPTSPRETS
jgi:aerobic-type carbon monoxide dehydrogenase small subunit (CoxS/CutS family)|tara:strand:- start:5152 stop:5634 length:483 start_codon:yes stop_codon:yes gene_type:complete